jgi:hypothetical protein
MKKLIKGESDSGIEYNEKVLITATYMHDIGYFGLVTEDTPEGHATAKTGHMEKGATLARQILDKDFEDDYTPPEIERIVHLVFVHDSLDRLSDPDEILLMEADALAHIDPKRCPSSYDREHYFNFLGNFLTSYGPRIQTNTGKKYFMIQLQKAIEFGFGKS